MNKLYLTKAQYLSVTKIINEFWLDKEQIKERLVNFLNEPQIDSLYKWIPFTNKRCQIGVIHKENYPYWLEAFERLRKGKVSLEEERTCCQLRKNIYDFIESEDSMFMNEKNVFSVHYWVIMPWIKLKLLEKIEKSCGSCNLLVNDLESDIDKWNKEKRFYLPYEQRF